jgi:DNA-binding SARP family transcriptional activator
LRQSLGNEEYIRLKNGRLSLSEEHCWVDAVAFQQAVTASGQGDSEEKKERISRKALSHYQGLFLPEDLAVRWTAPMRERSRRMSIRLLERTAEAFCGRGLFADAAECYEKAIEMDELHEGLYARLMDCYGRMGRKDKVKMTYRNCCEALQSHLDTGPSKAAQRLYGRLTAGDNNK